MPVDLDSPEDLLDMTMELADSFQGNSGNGTIPLPTLAPLAYDFDIVSIPPDAAQQAHLDALAALGQETDGINIEARWRDPATATALFLASPGVRKLFADAGFSQTPSDAHLAPGTYPAEDAEARHAIVMRLTDHLAESDAANFDWGRIDITAFFKAHAEARSIRSEPVASTDYPPASNKRKFALIGLVAGLVLVVVAGLSAL